MIIVNMLILLVLMTTICLLRGFYHTVCSLICRPCQPRQAQPWNPRQYSPLRELGRSPSAKGSFKKVAPTSHANTSTNSIVTPLDISLATSPAKAGKRGGVLAESTSATSDSNFVSLVSAASAVAKLEDAKETTRLAKEAADVAAAVAAAAHAQALAAAEKAEKAAAAKVAQAKARGNEKALAEAKAEEMQIKAERLEKLQEAANQAVARARWEAAQRVVALRAWKRQMEADALAKLDAQEYGSQHSPIKDPSTLTVTARPIRT